MNRDYRQCKHLRIIRIEEMKGYEGQGLAGCPNWLRCNGCGFYEPIDPAKKGALPPERKPASVAS